MPPRSSWKGFLRLSLVSVPVKAYTASATGAEVRLNQLHTDCHQRVRYQKRCPDHGELSGDAIVSGYEYAKGQYVVVDPAELEKLRTESDRAITLDGFVAEDALDPVYLGGRTWFLLPDGAVGQKPYALLRQSMEEGGLHAIAQVVLSGREQVVLVRPLGGLLAMTALTYQDRVKSPDSFRDELTETELSREERDLTRMLVDASRIEDFDFGKYRDAYTEKLTRLIETKVEGKEVVAVPDPEQPRILNLMAALKESVAQATGAAPAGGRKKAAAKKKKAPAAKKKMAPSAKARKAASRKKKTG